jgi:hypothetical protein
MMPSRIPTLKLRLRGNRSHLTFYYLAFCSEAAAHFTGARNDRVGKKFRFLNQDLGVFQLLTNGA